MAAAAQGNFQATLEAEKSRLIEENEQDCENRRRRAFSIIHLGTDYNVWELAYKYADLAILAEKEGKPGPKPYDRMARTRWTVVDPKYQSGDSAGTPVNDAPYDQQGVLSTPGDEILEESGSLDGEETIQQSDSTESTMEPDAPQEDEETGSKNVPRSLRQMLKRPGEEPAQPSSQRRRVPPAPAPAFASARRQPAPARPTSASMSLRDLGLGSGPAEARAGEPEVPSSQVLVVASGSNAAGGGVTPQPKNQDASSRWPDLQNYAKRMLRSLTRSEKELVPGINQVNIDCINSLLAEVMLWVDGMKVLCGKSKRR
ncbi:probable endo-1,3(4)-beta-glucanase AFLA_105200 [Chenopodium quinoa]|uniref:probable endo-1,3(4)-beta-glucanase AFLA_105200 n=1 Tax=Chenopodium quinoa TaxID=63459 RepID=UPI000B773D71|nr:probable endo-1,3(4)-beta-glucanase AFLA_105200 [Chenopodium quinoa]